MGVYCIRFQLSVLTGSSAADRCDSRKCIMSFSWPAMGMRLALSQENSIFAARGAGKTTTQIFDFLKKWRRGAGRKW